MIRRYSELIQLSSYEERLEYLRLSGSVGLETFGWDRIFNQQFYRSKEWKQLRNEIIYRDNGCDLACPDRVIENEPIYIHHMNPILLRDITEESEFLLTPEYLISTSFDTHQRIHYGIKDSKMPKAVLERKPNDTCPWR